MKKYLAVFVAMMIDVNAYAECSIALMTNKDLSNPSWVLYSRDGSTESANGINIRVNPAIVTPEGKIFAGWVGDTSAPGVVSQGMAIPNGERTDSTGTFTTYRYEVPFVQSGATCANTNVNISITPLLLPVPQDSASGAGIPTSKSYTDAQMDTRQPKFSGLGNDKLMLYSDTTDGVVVSRDIVTTLGTGTTATTVPTRGAVRTGLNTKQDILNGTAGSVVTYTGTTGSLAAKPVYSSTNNIKTALIEADDLNSVITNAVNSSLTPVSGIGWRINTVENLTLPALRTPVPDASIAADGRCSRALSGDVTYSFNDCGSAVIISELGAQDNKSGRFGVPFEYGNIIGRSVCSAIAASGVGQVATDAENATMNSEFASQTGIGTDALNYDQSNCWCKTESWDGAPMVSSWVFAQSRSPLEFCARGCSFVCGNRLRDNETFRTALYNSVQ